MDSARWSHVQEIFHQALALAESERAAFLDSTCAGDPELASAVTAMLAADSRKSSLLDLGLPEIAQRMIGSSTDLNPLQVFGPYRLMSVLGEGGMGVVWLAERVDAGKMVAIKFLPHAGFTPARRERFDREVKTLAKLEHQYIARLYDTGTLADGTPWFVMEYVNGEPIDAYCASHNLSLEERLRLFRSTCEAVQFAHSRAILHRDLKPSNILIAQDEKPRLLDFGIAKELQSIGEIDDATSPGLRFLSWDYAAPEWVSGGIQGLYTDVYSLGVILYQLLTGRLPFDRTRVPPAEFISYLAANDPEKPSTVARRKEHAQGTRTWQLKLDKSAWNELDILCLKAMHRDVRKRYQSTEALIRDIDHYLKDETLEAQPDTAGYRIAKFVRRNNRAVLAAAATIALIVGLTVFFTFRLASARDRAVAEAARARRIQHFMLNLLGGSDQETAPSESLRVVTLLDHGVQEADSLRADPDAQGDLYENLGNMYDMLGEYAKSEKLLWLALDRRKNAPSPDDAKIAEVLVRIGVVKGDESQFDEAEKYVRQGLNLVSSRRPPNDADVLAARSALGRVITEYGDFSRSIAILQPLVDRQSTGSETDYSLSDSLSSLAISEYAIGNTDLSESLIRRSLDLDRHLFGPTHPQVSEDLINAGMNKAAAAHYQEAESDYRQGLEIEIGWYGPDHPSVADDELLLGRTLLDEGKLEEAGNLMQHLIPLEERLYGKSDGQLAAPLNTLGRIDLDRGKLSQAEPLLARALELARPVYGDDGYQTAVFASDLGDLYLREKRYALADKILAESTKNLLKQRSPSTLTTAAVQLSWGRTLFALKRYSEAERQLSAAYRTYTAQGSLPLTELQTIRKDLVATYIALNQLDNAKRLRAEIANATTAAVSSPK
jgi:eukaryotic-like serine/threonine-protein kinase